MLTDSTDQTVFMPGPLTDGHHQLQLACTACHAEPMGGKDVFQDACLACHGDARKKPYDSHPVSKFRDPRNADRLGDIDALHCVTCHTEHRPEMTGANGLSRPRDLCIHCHEDVAEERPSHEGMAFSTCANAGCHNFHNNRSLYTKFLIEHLDEPAIMPEAVVPDRAFAGMLDQIPDYPLDRFPVAELSAGDADAGFEYRVAGGASDPLDDWSTTAHARSGVNCSGCHLVADAGGTSEQWVEKPEQAVCEKCHSLELQRFQQGRHGMRLAVGLPPVRVREARLPMRQDAEHESVTCNNCHPAHRYDITHAAAEACMECHDDRHTRAYIDSPHHVLWKRELAGELGDGAGVSCATCHMPRLEHDVNEWFSRMMVDHNQSANLSPNSKMIRSVCLSCHGLTFSIDALADSKLIDNNFRGKPSLHVETMDLAAREKERRDREGDSGDGGMFGF